MNQKLVTIFIPAYNAEKYIKECLDSIVNQTYKNLDILIIDDGSTDNTSKIIETYNDERIRLIKNKENKGLPYTRNLGLKESKGEYIAIMDADDISYIDRIEKQVNVLNKNNKIDVVISQAEMFGGKVSRIWKPPVSNEEIKVSLLFINRICNPTAMLKRDSLKKFNIKYNDQCFVAQDYELWCQISKVGYIHTIEEPLLKYRFGHENITKRSKLSSERYYKRKYIIDCIHNDLLDFYKFNLKDEEKHVFNDFFNDNPINSIDYKDVKNLKEILNKIIYTNKKYLFFDEKILIHMMDVSIIKQIHLHKLNLKEKIILYNSLVNYKLKNNKELIKLFIKHLCNN